MYATTPVVNGQMKIMAFNAVTGQRYWETTYNLGTFLICCGPVNRGRRSSPTGTSTCLRSTITSWRSTRAPAR